MRNNSGGRRQALKDRLARSIRAPIEVRQLARAISDATDPSLTHEECRANLPAYIDAEIGGLPAAQKYPHVKHHIDLCADCEAEYIAGLQVALLEEAGQLPVPDRVPAVDLSFLPSLSFADYVRQLAEDIIHSIEPNLVGELQAIADLFFERVEALGRQFKFGSNAAPALGFGAGETPESLKLLAATYAATQALTSDRSAQEIEDESRSGQLLSTLHAEAQQAARNMQLTSAQTQRFAAKFAELASYDARTLQQLAARSS